MYQRDGQVYIKFVRDAEKNTLQNIIRGRIELAGDMYSDKWKSYNGLEQQGYNHEVIDHGNEEYVKEDNIHINGIEGFWGY